MELEVEKKYQKKTQLEHILLRPDTYIGSNQHQTQTLWVVSRTEEEQFEYRTIDYVPGLYKIFDEILVNAADNYQNDKRMNKIDVVIDAQKNFISVRNNGKGIPVQIHKTEKMYVPELIFGHLLTSSNYDDDQKKVVGGRNGFGAKLANIFSTEFTIETADMKNGKKFKKTWRNNMSTSDETEIVSYKEGGDFTKVSFKPDLKKFHMKYLDDDICDLLKKRVYDIAGVIGGNVRVTLNGKIIPIKGFNQYCDMYLTANSKMNNDQEIIKITDNKGTNNARWEVIVSISEGQFQQVSFVNSICTIKGGTHVDYITNQITDQLLAHMQKKKEKGQVIKPFHIKQHMWVFVNCLIENPSFDSQTKETLTIKQSAFGSTCTISEKMVKDLIKSKITNHVLLQIKAKEQAKMNKQFQGKKQSRLLGIPKLEDANNAGTRLADQCTLIVTEGDSAKSLAMAGIELVGRDFYGVFPLKGKMLNVRDSTTKQITDNQEIQNIIKIMGLQMGKKYTDVKTLRYGSILIMADQDTDGSHIKGLFINFIQHFWPSLYRMPGFLKCFITPLIKAKKGNQDIQFFTQQDFDAWLENLQAPKTWNFKYYKGLGTSTDKEGQQYFSQLQKHTIIFDHQNEVDDLAMDLAFNKKKADDRKQWLANFDPKTSVDYSVKKLRYETFVNKELIQFSVADCARSIPSLVDGFKPGQRKILYACFKRNLTKEIKVAQLSGYVAEHSAYHHGETSLAQTIIGMAQNFVGSNNINYLMPVGQFGSRSQGGKDAASARYIHTLLNKVTRFIYPEPDDHVLSYLEDDGQLVEPEYYIPIIPTALVNGQDGIGTGWSTNIPQYNPRELCLCIREKLEDDLEFQELIPWYKGFIGEITPNNKGGFVIKGNYNIINEDTIDITEIPIKRWTRDYKNYLEEMMNPKEGEPEIEDIKEYHAGNRVHFRIKLTPKGQKNLRDPDSIEKMFKLQSSLQVTNLVMFNSNGQIQKYNGVSEIMQEFYYVRLKTYEKRKEFLISKIQRDLEIAQNKKRFILAVINEEIQIKNIKRKQLVQNLQQKGFKMLKQMTKIKSTKLHKIQLNNAENSDEEFSENSDPNDEIAASKEYNYLLSMPMWSLTFEKVEELKKQVLQKENDLQELRNTTSQQMWLKDLTDFENMLDVIEEEEENEIMKRMKVNNKQNTKNNNKNKKNKKSTYEEDSFIEDDDEDSDFATKKPKKQKVKKQTENSQNDLLPVNLSQQLGISSKINANQRQFAPKISLSQTNLSQTNKIQNSQTEANESINGVNNLKNSQISALNKSQTTNNHNKKKQNTVFECEKDNIEEQRLKKLQEEEEEKKVNPMSSFLKYLTPQSQNSQPTFSNYNSQQQNNNNINNSQPDTSLMSLEERLMQKEKQGLSQTFQQAYTSIKKEKTPEKLDTNIEINLDDDEDDEINKLINEATNSNKDNNNTKKRKNPETKGKRLSKKVKKIDSASENEQKEEEFKFEASDNESFKEVTKKSKAKPPKKQPSTNKTSKKGNKKKKYSFEDEEEEDISNIELSDLGEDSEGLNLNGANLVSKSQNLPQRTARRAAAKKQVKYVESEDNDEEDIDEDFQNKEESVDSQSDEEFQF